MPSNQLPIHQILTTASSLLGILALSTGIYGFLNPQAFSATLGIPIPISRTSSKLSRPRIRLLHHRSKHRFRRLDSGAAGNGSDEGCGYGDDVRCCGLSGGCLGFVQSRFGESAVEGKAAGHAFMGDVVGAIGGGLY